MGAKQKILVFILLIAIFVAFFFGWHFVVKKPNLANEENFAKDKEPSKIVAMLKINKNKKADYDELLNKYKELKNKRISLDDQISDIEQQIAKINKANPTLINAGEENIVVLTDEKTKQKEVSVNEQKPASEIALTAASANANSGLTQKQVLSGEDNGNALSPAPLVSLSSSTETNASEKLVASEETKNTAAKAAKTPMKVVIISPKKKNGKQLKVLASNQTKTTPPEENTSLKVNQENTEKASVTELNKGNEPTITVTKNSVEEKASSVDTSGETENKVSVGNEPQESFSSSAQTVSSSATVSTTPKAKNVTKAKYYVVQIMSSDKASDITNFIKRKGLDGKAVALKTQRNGKDWYILAYGNYDSGSAAANAIKTLPSSLRALHPWVKPISSSSVQDLSESKE